MFTAYLIVTVTTVAMNAWAAVADFARAKFVLANSAEVGVPESLLPLLGVLKAAGAAGLLVGVLVFRPLGIAATIGLVLFFAGAIVTHIRAQVLHNLAFPGFYLGLALGSLLLAAMR
jgi:DoxX-like family